MWSLDFLLSDLKLLLWSTSVIEVLGVSPLYVTQTGLEFRMILGLHYLGAEIIGVSCHTQLSLKYMAS